MDNISNGNFLHNVLSLEFNACGLFLYVNFPVHCSDCSHSTMKTKFRASDSTNNVSSSVCSRLCPKSQFFNPDHHERLIFASADFHTWINELH